MNENQEEITPKLSPPQATMKRRFEVLFEFVISKSRAIFYRGVRAADGSFRMEKRGQAAKKFRAVMWCGSEEGLLRHKEAVEFYSRK